MKKQLMAVTIIGCGLYLSLASRGVCATQSPPPQAKLTASIIATVPGIAGLTTDSNGNIFVASSENNSIIKLNPSGQLEKVIGPRLTDKYNLAFPHFMRIPIHVDHLSRIYVASGPYLFVLSDDGNLRNVDTTGRLLPGFVFPSAISWIGTTRTGDVYVYPSLDDDGSMMSIISSKGEKISSFGDGLFTRTSRFSSTRFRIAMGEDGDIYAFPSYFAWLFRYSGTGRFLGYAQLRCPDDLEREVAKRNISLEQAFAMDAKGGSLPSQASEAAAGLGMEVYLDAHVLDANNILCLTNRCYLLWYDGSSGELVRSLNLWTSVSPPLFLYRFALGPRGEYIIGNELLPSRSSNIYKINLQ